MGDVIPLKVLLPMPLCGRKPNLPAPMQWSGCGLLMHSDNVDHVSIQDGVRITWNSRKVAYFRAMMMMIEDA